MVSGHNFACMHACASHHPQIEKEEQVYNGGKSCNYNIISHSSGIPARLDHLGGAGAIMETGAKKGEPWAWILDKHSVQVYTCYQLHNQACLAHL